jgi:hypothetical protein
LTNTIFVSRKYNTSSESRFFRVVMSKSEKPSSDSSVVGIKRIHCAQPGGKQDTGDDASSVFNRDDEKSEDGEDTQSSSKQNYMTFDEIQRERRLALNRASARDRRKRKNDTLETLSIQVSDLTKKLAASDNENKSLRARVVQLEAALKQTELTVSTLPSMAPSALSSLVRNSVLEEQALQHLLHGVPVAGSAPAAGLLGRHQATSEVECASVFDNIQRLIAQQQGFHPPALSRATGVGNTGTLGESNEALLRAMLLMKSGEVGSSGMQRLPGMGDGISLASRAPSATIPPASDGVVGPLSASYSSYLRHQSFQPAGASLASTGRENLDSAVLKLLSGFSSERGEIAPGRKL